MTTGKKKIHLKYVIISSWRLLSLAKGWELTLNVYSEIFTCPRSFVVCRNISQSSMVNKAAYGQGAPERVKQFKHGALLFKLS